MSDDLRQEYKVRGRWPFPMDMLRRDGATPATEADTNHVRALSGDFCPESTTVTGIHEIKLVRTQPHKWSTPLFERWTSFQWEVVPESLPEHLRPMTPTRRRESNIRSIKTPEEARERVTQIANRAERDPEVATGMERDFHRDVLYTVGNGLTEHTQEIAKIAFETWRLDFLRC